MIRLKTVIRHNQSLALLVHEIEKQVIEPSSNLRASL